MAVNPVNGNEAQIDQANIAMRASPWYQQLLASFGQRPDAVKLTDSQRQQVMAAARQNGYDVDKSFEIDPGGNFNPKGHKLRNTLIVAGIAGATIATMGAAGVFAGGAAAAGSGAGAGAAGAAGAGAAGAGAAAGTGAAAAGGLGAAAAGGTAAATGAGAATAAGAAGGLGAWGPIISGGIGAATSIYGANKQASSIDKATDAQTAANREALDFTKQQYGDRMKLLQPYQQLGADSLGLLRGLSGVPMSAAPAPTAGATPQPNMPNMPNGPTTYGTGTMQGAPPQTSGFTPMRAPDGSVQNVPAHLVQMAAAKGATPIGGGGGGTLAGLGRMGGAL